MHSTERKANTCLYSYQDEPAHEVHNRSEYYNSTVKAMGVEGLLAKAPEIKVLKKVGGFSKS